MEDISKDLYKNILVDIDAILDTRLPLIYTISKDVVAEIAFDKYINRIIDNFPMLPYKVFNLLYSRRNKAILTNALPTHIFLVINKYLTNLELVNLSTNDPIVMYINFYPYVDLNSSEIEIFTDLIAKMYPMLKIEPVIMSNADISPDWLISKEIEIFIKYNGLDWIDYNFVTGRLFKTPLIKKCTLILPALVKNIKKDIKITKATFESLTKTLAPFVDIMFIDTVFFSAEILTEKKEDIE